MVEKWLFSTPLLFVNRFVTKFGANSVPFSAMASSPPEQTTFQRHGGKRLKRPRCLPLPPTSSSSSPPPPTFPSTITKTTRIQEPERGGARNRPEIESSQSLNSPRQIDLVSAASHSAAGRHDHQDAEGAHPARAQVVPTRAWCTTFRQQVAMDGLGLMEHAIKHHLGPLRTQKDQQGIRDFTWNSSNSCKIWEKFLCFFPAFQINWTSSERLACVRVGTEKTTSISEPRSIQNRINPFAIQTSR